MEFTYEILDPATINVRFQYGGEWFEFNLFHKEGQWILHPFEATLLGNPEMCRLVVADLLANKPFQVMLAKERIRLSALRTSIDVSGSIESESFERNPRFDRDPAPAGPHKDHRESAAADSLEEWIREFSLEEILAPELQRMEERQQLFNSLLQKMFYENLGPGHEEFDKIQEVSRMYKEATGKLGRLIR